MVRGTESGVQEVQNCHTPRSGVHQGCIFTHSGICVRVRLQYAAGPKAAFDGHMVRTVVSAVVVVLSQGQYYTGLSWVYSSPVPLSTEFL